MKIRLVILVLSALTASCSLTLAVITAIERSLGYVSSAHLLFASLRYIDDPQNPIRDCHQRVCVINSNLGGRIVAFLAGDYQLKKDPTTLVVINGTCVSACATFAAYGRPQVCVTRDAVFGFHRGTDENDQPLPHDIREWVLDNGGFPTNKSGEINWMVHEKDIKKFWVPCPPAQDPAMFTDMRSGFSVYTKTAP